MRKIDVGFYERVVSHIENAPSVSDRPQFEEEKERRRKQQERLDSEAWQEDMYYDAQNGEAEE